jgi:hypothetical protein
MPGGCGSQWVPPCHQSASRMGSEDAESPTGWAVVPVPSSRPDGEGRCYDGSRRVIESSCSQKEGKTLPFWDQRRSQPDVTVTDDLILVIALTALARRSARYLARLR